MPTTPGGITYKIHEAGSGENPAGYKEHWVDGNNQATMNVQVAVGDWRSFCIEFLGESEWVAQNGGGYALSRSLPMVHPRYSWMVGQELEIVEAPAIVNPTDGFYDDSALFVASATFRGVMFNGVGMDDATAQAAAGGEMNRFVEKERSNNTKNLTIKNSVTRFKDVPTVVLAGAEGIMEYSWTTFIYKWHNVPTLANEELPPQLQANIDACAGKINSVAFDGRDPGTMLCHDPKITRFRNAIGRMMCQIEIPVEYQAGGWNYKYRLFDETLALRPGFYPVEVLQYLPNAPGVAIVSDLYQSADLNNLFKAM